ncbi:DUF4392 domain-containing protein [SAR202 cluster bacterium AD-804-J14_MRT_500m]|nr:DUF4392 domain-containing protein [SAR202 cluster bacterium AD-804-J14_MRT_500m]
MVSLPTEEQFPYENLDRLSRVKMRPRGMSAFYQISDFVYHAAKGSNPISMDIAMALDPVAPKTIGIFTGACSPEHYPNGENDGPLGTIVLANALLKLGHTVKIFADPPVQPVLQGLMEYYGQSYPIILLDIESEKKNLESSAGLNVAIAVEKSGVNPVGHLHSITGTTRDGTRAKVEPIFNSVKENGGVTISCADGHNEVGFGNVYDAVAEVAPWTTKCKCDCAGGVMSNTPVDHLYVTAISNWSAYSVVTALALYNKEPGLLHGQKAEQDIEQLALDYDVRDGFLGKAGLTVDGVPLEVNSAVIEMMRNLVEISLTEYVRNF